MGTRWMITSCAGLGIGCMLAMPAAAAPEALNQVPDGADAVLIVPSLSKLNEELANLRQELNLPVPELADALGAMKQQTGMVNGVNDDGSMLLVLPDLAEAAKQEREPQFVLLVPVSDYNAFVGNFGGQAAAGGDAVTELTMPGGESGFARQLGEFAVLGQDQAAVAGFTPGNAADAIVAKVGQLGDKYAGEADLLFYIDMEKVGPSLLPLIDEGVNEATAQMDEMAAMGMMDANTLAQGKAFYALYGTAAKAIINDANGLIVGLDFTESGIGLTYAAGIEAGSETAKLLPGGAGESGKMLASLPEKPFIFALAFDGQAIGIGDLYERMISAMPEGAMAGMPDPKKWLPLVQNIQEGSFAFYAPDEMALMNQQVLNTLSVVAVKDAPGYVGALKEYINTLNGVSVPVAVPGEPAADGGAAQSVTYNTTYTDNMLQLEGTQVDQYSVRSQLPPELMQQMGPGMAPMMQMFTSYTGYIAAKDNKVLITTVPDTQVMTSAFAAMNGGGIGAAGAISNMRDVAMPPGTAVEGYLSFAGIAQTANLFIPMMGMPPIVVPADLPPVAMGLGIQDNSVAYRTYVPLDTVKFVMGVVQQFTGGMMGPQPGGPGGPPPF